MFAKTATQLRRMLKENPGAFPSTFIEDGSFAAHCFDNKTVRELKSLFNGDADPSDCRRWGLTAAEWRRNIEMALIALQSRP